MKLTPRKIKSLIKEEKQATRMYKGYGLFGIARQEASHVKKLTNLLGKNKRV